MSTRILDLPQRLLHVMHSWVFGLLLSLPTICFIFVIDVYAQEPIKPIPEGEEEEEPLKPIPERVEVNAEKARLGRMLFYDPRLSKENTISCYSCHNLKSGGDDGRQVSIGIEGKPGVVNSPTVFNVGFNSKQLWDGRAPTLEDQIDRAMQSPIVMGSLWPEVLDKLHEHETYPKRFNALYPDGITAKNIKNALSAFLMSLITPHSRFDQWLKGDDTALTGQEKRGYALFKDYGCASCHQGRNVGGNTFQLLGVFKDYFKTRGNITEADLGRFNVTGNPADRYVFRVPSLRLAALTAPYLHDGSVTTLREAVDIMFEFQMEREAPDEDKEAIVAFIRALVGESTDLSP